VQLRA
jgi:hypothetical protein